MYYELVSKGSKPFLHRTEKIIKILMFKVIKAKLGVHHYKYRVNKNMREKHKSIGYTCQYTEMYSPLIKLS